MKEINLPPSSPITRDTTRMVKTAIAAFLTLATANTVMAATPATASQEKCYGIVKAGMNDCSTATQSCAGSATKDKQPDAFLLVPKGLCNKITDGSLTAKTEKKPQ